MAYTAEERRIYNARYYASEKGRALRERDKASGKRAEVARRYNATPKRRAALSRYNAARPRTVHRLRADAIKLDAGCADCGYRAHSVALDFDHLDASTKLGTIAIMISDELPWEVIEAEIAKCEVVCSNCHRVRTAQRRLTRS